MDERTRRLLERGREHYASGEFDKAERALNQVVREHLPFADVYHMLGVILAHRGMPKKAQQMFEEALRLNPGYTEAAMNLAVTYNEQGRYEDAKDVYKRMLAARRANSSSQVDPFVKGKIANMHAEVAQAYEQAALWAEAIREYERALELCPTFVDLRTKLAAAYRASGNIPAAVREFERAKRENPKLAGPRLQLGMTHYAAGRFEEAGREWREVSAMEPGNKFAQMYLQLLAQGPKKPTSSRRGS